MSDSVTTYTTCWKVTLQDSSVLGFTDHDQDLTVDSVLYKSAVGYVPSAVRDTDNLSPGNMDIAGIISDDGISEDDLHSGRFDYAQIEIFMVDYNNTAAGAVMTLISGRLGQVMIKDHQFIAELNDLAHQMSGNIGELYGILCAAQLGDARCGVNMAPWTVTGVLAADGGKRVFVDANRSEPDGYWNNGTVVFTGGDNAGYLRDIKRSFSNGSIELYEPLPNDTAATDTYEMKAGCGRAKDECKNRFNNLINFRGFPHLRGLSELFRGPQ